MGNLALWIVQLVLAAMFVFAGSLHAFRFDTFAARPRMGWANAVGRDGMRVIGLLEIAGGIGIVVPAASGLLPWLTPLAAAGLIGIMLSAATFHVRRGEPAVANVVLAGLALLIVVGRTAAVPL